MLSHLHNRKSEILAINRKNFKSGKRFERDCVICQKRAHLLQRFQFAPPSAQTFFLSMDFIYYSITQKATNLLFVLVYPKNTLNLKTAVFVLMSYTYLCATIIYNTYLHMFCKEWINGSFYPVCIYLGYTYFFIFLPFILYAFVYVCFYLLFPFSREPLSIETH
jgi:hypothetical protein